MICLSLREDDRNVVVVALVGNRPFCCPRRVRGESEASPEV